MEHIIKIFGLCYIFFFETIYSHTIKVMTVEKIPREILNATDEEIKNLPSNYETIQIWYPKDGIMISMHDHNYVSFYAFGKNSKVPLKPIESSLIGEETFIWLAQMKNGEFNLKKLPIFTMKQEFQMYATSEHTVIGTGFMEGVAYFAGKVGNLTLLPVKKETSEKLRRRKRDIDNELLLPGTKDPTGNFILSDYHIIYISSDQDNTDFPNAIKTSLKDKKNINLKKIENIPLLKKTKRDLTDQQETIYPQILLYADLGSQFIEPEGILFNRYILYLISFWNGVNLYFSHLENPRVSFKLTGIIIAMDPAAVPFFINNHAGFEKIYPRRSIEDMNIWFSQHNYMFPKKTYDIAITMTSRTMLERFGRRNMSFDGALIPIARCKGTELLKNVSAIIHDNMDYSGISTSIKELAYLLNAAEEKSMIHILNTCNSYDGAIFYIPSKANKKLPNIPSKLAWMHCSQHMLSYLPMQGKEVCSKSESTVYTGKPIPNVLPAEVSSLDEQCQILGYSLHCKLKGFEICKVSGCYTSGIRGFSNFWACSIENLALDGAQCGENKYCYAGECVSYAKNKIFQTVN